MATLPNCFSAPLKINVTEDILTINLHAKHCTLLLHHRISTNHSEFRINDLPLSKKCFDKEIIFVFTKRLFSSSTF